MRKRKGYPECHLGKVEDSFLQDMAVYRRVTEEFRLAMPKGVAVKGGKVAVAGAVEVVAVAAVITGTTTTPKKVVEGVDLHAVIIPTLRTQDTETTAMWTRSSGHHRNNLPTGHRLRKDHNGLRLHKTSTSFHRSKRGRRDPLHRFHTTRTSPKSRPRTFPREDDRRRVRT